MKKTIFGCCLIVVLLLANPGAFAQDDKKEQIAKTVTDYFFLERENIHVHLDKNVFTTFEDVWFKGYVFHRKKNIPFFSTVNINAILMDSGGKIITSQLIYGNTGSFSGVFKLDDNLASGKYYLQFYTNWMNNFVEDESAVYEISVINQKTGAGTALAKADPSKINIEFNPEGGTLINGTTNSIGIHISDCNYNPLPVSTVDIADNSGKIIKKVQIDKLGYGKFDLQTSAASGYKAVANIEGVKHEQLLPIAQNKGIALEINNYTSADKTIVTIRTNKATLDSFIGKPLYLLVHNDDKATVFDVGFTDTKLEQVFIIPNSGLPDGMSTMRFIDNEMNELAQRMIYKDPQLGLGIDIAKTGQTVNQIEYKGKVNHPNMNLSISVLPENTMSLEETNDIFSSFLIQPYLDNQNQTAGKYYFNSLSKVKLYELDLFLVNQKSKYQWYNIMNNPPKDNYTFDMGLTLKGILPPSAGEAKNTKVRLYSLTATVDEVAEVNDKREFYFNNMVIPDSTYINFSLIKNGAKPKELALMPLLLNAKKSFNKLYKPKPRCYASQENPLDLKNPVISKETTQLEEISISGNALKYAKIAGNRDLKGYKISDTKAGAYQNLINFIKAYSNFEIYDRDGSFVLQSRGRNSVNAAQSGPIVYIDNIQILGHVIDALGIDYSSAFNSILMKDVDEVYISSTAIVPSLRNYVGVIKIYLKRGPGSDVKRNTSDIIVENGFEKVVPFQNVTYTSTEDAGFENFGLVDWKPNVTADNNGEFTFSIPKMYLKPIKVLIEGFSADGKLVSEIKTLNIK